MKNKHKEREREEVTAVVSEQMKAKVKEAVRKNGMDYFLVATRSYRKIKDGFSAIKFPLADLEAYESKFVKPFKHTLNDEFVFSQYAKTKRSDHNEKQADDGYFMPAMFWETVYKQAIRP